MSPSEEIAEIVATVSDVNISSYVNLASITFFTYDFLVTLIREVELIWKGRRSLASALFVLIRYPALFNVFVAIVQNYESTSESCDALVKINAFTAYFQYIPCALFSGLRAYALCRSWIISGLITVLSLAPVGVNFTAYTNGYHGELDPLIGCTYVQSTTSMELIIFPVVSRGGLIIADLLLIIITWRALGSGPLARPYHVDRSHMTFSNICLWNGTIYFVLLFILNVLHLSFTMNSIFGNFNNHASEITQFTEPLTTILIYRFIMDLQEANRQEMKLDSDDPLYFSTDKQGTLSFARIIGSLGSTLVPGVSTATSHWEEEEQAEGDERGQRSSVTGPFAAESPVDVEMRQLTAY